jgi:5'-3' exonuclease/20S proteasome alpha/beta subunit
MGVPKFFRWLSERYPKINQRIGRIPESATILEHYGQLPATQVLPDDLSTCSIFPEIDRLYIDMNGVIHGCSHNNSGEDEESLGETVVDGISEAEIFRNICYYLDRIIRDIAKPRELVYLAIDGVAPRAKLNQQRARRYRAGKEGLIEKTVYDAHLKKVEEYGNDSDDPDNDNSSDEYDGQQQRSLRRAGSLFLEEIDEEDAEDADLEEIEPGRFAGKFLAHLDNLTHSKISTITDNDDESQGEVFDSNVITPGTPFFERCTRHIEHFIQRKLTEDPAWQHLTIIFSSSNVPGEGEHKIMQFMREQKTAYQHGLPTTYHPNLRHCIMGQDGDLMILGLATHEPNLVLLREQVLFDARRQAVLASTEESLEGYVHNPNFELLHLNVLRDYLAYEFETSNVLDTPWSLERCIDDFVFMTFFVGNDFLPHMPALDIADEAFDLLFYTYREQRKKWLKDKTMAPYLIENGAILSGKRLEKFLSVLGSHELPYYQLKKKSIDLDRDREIDARYKMRTVPSDEAIAAKEANDRERFRERLAELLNRDKDHTEIMQQFPDFRPVLSSVSSSAKRKSSSKTNDDEQDADALVERVGNILRNTVDFKGAGADALSQIDDQDIKGRYYSDKFGFSPFDAEKHIALRKAYVEGLVWNLKYYFEGVPSWSWFYPYHYGPMLSDLVNLEDYLSEISFLDKMGEPLKPFEQLMACMPPSNADVLPEPFRGLMTNEDSPIADFYPTSFTIDMNGKRWPWEAVVLLPFIDSNRLLDAVSTVDKNLLSEEELRRNVVGETVVFSNDKTYCSKVDPVGEGEMFSAIENCNVRRIPFHESALAFKSDEVKPLFTPLLSDGVQIPLPGLPTLRDSMVKSLWRKLIRINIHGSRSRYKTCCLEIENRMPEVLPAEALAEHLNGTMIWINFPHYLEAFVTAVSDNNVIIRGKEKPKYWDTKELGKRKRRIQQVVDQYVFGESLVGTGGISLVGGDDAMQDLEVLIHVRPFSGLKTLSDGTVVKTYADFELEVPLFVTGWAPVQVDSRLLDVPVRLEKDPFNAAKFVLHDKRIEEELEHKKLWKELEQQKTYSFMKLNPSLNDGPALMSARGLHSLAVNSLNVGHNEMQLSTRSSLSYLCRKWESKGHNRCFSQVLVSEHSRNSRDVGRFSFLSQKSPRFTARRGLFIFGIAAAFSFFSGASASDLHGSTFASPSRKSSHGSLSLTKSFISTKSNCLDDDSQFQNFLDKRPVPPLEFAHGTTTLAFTFQGGIVAAVDSRASMGSFVGSKTTQKVLPINSHILGTMAGGAADCMFWIRKLRCEAALHELTEGYRMSVARASRLLSAALYRYRGYDLSIGTMIMGFDDPAHSVCADTPPKIYYIDSTGMRIFGDMFAVGSGSTFALSILDADRGFEMSADEAVALGIKAIRHSTFRDTYSGGFINVYLITKETGWQRVFTEDLDQLNSSSVVDDQQLAPV